MTGGNGRVDCAVQDVSEGMRERAREDHTHLGWRMYVDCA
jgi:hypothetical protein